MAAKRVAGEIALAAAGLVVALAGEPEHHGHWGRVRHVRTPAGEKEYHEPLGALIVARARVHHLVSHLKPAAAGELKPGDRALLPEPETGKLVPAHITSVTHDGEHVAVEVVHVSRGGPRAVSHDMDRSAVLYHIPAEVQDTELGPFPDEVQIVPEEPPPLEVRSLDEFVNSGRPVLYTYQRQKVVALGLDKPGEVRDPELAQAAARVRQRLPVSAKQADLLAAELERRANSITASRVQQRSLSRVAGRMRAARDEVQGRSFGIELRSLYGRESVRRTTVSGLTEGDSFVVRSRSPQEGVVARIDGIRPVMGGRVIELDIEHDDGTREVRPFAGAQVAYLLPDRADDKPVPPPGQVREHITPDRVRIGDRIIDHGVGKEMVVTAVEPEYRMLRPEWKFGVSLPDGASTVARYRSYDGGPAVIRAARGEASQDQAWDSVMAAEHPEPVQLGDIRVGDRLLIGQTAVFGPRSGVVEALGPATGEDGVRGIDMQFRADNSSTDGVVMFPGDARVTRLTKADDNAEARIAQEKALRKKARVTDSVYSAVRQWATQFAKGDVATARLAISHPVAEEARRMIVGSSRGIGGNLESTVARRIAEEIGNYGEAALISDLEEKIKPLLVQVAADMRQNFFKAYESAVPLPGDLEGEPEYSFNPAIKARQRILGAYENLDDIPFSRKAAATLAEVASQIAGNPEVVPVPQVPVLPDSADLKARVAAYRAALPEQAKNIGSRLVRRQSFEAPNLADLEAGVAPAIKEVDLGAVDRAADGGPGEVAMRHLDIVMAAGRDLDSTLGQRQEQLLGELDVMGNLPRLEAELEAVKKESDELWSGMRRARNAASAAYLRENGFQSDTELFARTRELRDQVWREHGLAHADELRAEIARLNAVYEKASEAGKEGMTLAEGAYKAAREKVNAVRKEKDKLTKADADSRRQIAMDLLREVRRDGLGGGQSEWKDPSKGLTLTARHRLVRAMTWAEQHYPSSWLEKMRAAGPVKLGEISRGNHSAWNRRINLSKGASHLSSGGEYEHVAVHELGHEFESQIDGLRALQDAYLWSRTSSGEVGSRERDRKSIIYRNGNEAGYKDTFPEHYSGKTYESNTSDGRPANFEVFTTGAESLFAGSKYLDPSFRQFMLGTLALL